MCGIVGIQGKDYKKIINSIELIGHRGPDDDGYFINENCQLGLGHTRLSIQDTSDFAAKQPMIHSETGVAIIFNGEIYNFKQLRTELIAEGYKFSNSSDTEVLIILYLKYGEEIFEYINGIFSFAIWDPRSSTLLVARDRYGIKPLYYSSTEEKFIFSSEIKSLLPLMDKEFIIIALVNTFHTYTVQELKLHLDQYTKCCPVRLLLHKKWTHLKEMDI